MDSDDKKISQLVIGTPVVGDIMPYVSSPSASPSTKAAYVENIMNVNNNALYNGGLLTAQRGNGPFTSATDFVNNDDSYLIDGAIFLADGSDTCDISRVADNDFVSGYKLRMDVETSNRRFGHLFPIESKDIQTIRHKGTASLQFKVKCTGSSMSNVRAYLLAWSGTADSITSDAISSWGAAGANPTFATNWTAENTASNIAISTTVSTKKIEGIAIDTPNIKNLALLIILDDTDATVGDFLEIGDMKVEPGESCTDYKNESASYNYTRCLRYFEYWDMNSTSSSFPPLGIASSTNTAVLQIPCFPKRNSANNVFAVKDVAHLTFLTRTLSTLTGLTRLPNFMVASIGTASTWTNGAAGFLVVGATATWATISNEL